MTDTTGGEPPFTDAELKAARAQLKLRDAAKSIAGFFAGLHKSAEEELARFRAARERDAVRLIERQKRIDAAVEYLREQERQAGR